MGMADEIQRLNDLRRDGTLTEAEFAKAKAALLDAPHGATGAGPSPVGTSRSERPGSPGPDQRQERQWAMFVHLSLLAGLAVPLAGYVLPIVLWQMKKAEMPSIDAHGRVATNWIISSLIYWVIGAVLAFVLIGFPLLIALGVVSIIFPIVGALKANEGEVWKYPLTISFL